MEIIIIINKLRQVLHAKHTVDPIGSKIKSHHFFLRIKITLKREVLYFLDNYLKRVMKRHQGSW